MRVEKGLESCGIKLACASVTIRVQTTKNLKDHSSYILFNSTSLTESLDVLLAK